MTLPNPILEIKQRLWLAANKNLYTLTTAAANINRLWPGESIEDYEAILREVERMSVTKIVPITDTHQWRKRYAEAHKLNCQLRYPSVWKDGHYAPLRSIDYPDVTSHSGLNKFMADMLNWLGGSGTRFNVVARVENKITTTESGAKFTDKRYIKSSKRGLADVQGTLKGLRLQLDAKIGRDMPRTDQLKEQERERRAGGIYEFVHNTDEFFDLIDPILYG